MPTPSPLDPVPTLPSRILTLIYPPQVRQLELLWIGGIIAHGGVGTALVRCLSRIVCPRQQVVYSGQNAPYKLSLLLIPISAP